MPKDSTHDADEKNVSEKISVSCGSWVMIMTYLLYIVRYTRRDELLDYPSNTTARVAVLV